MTPGEAYHRAKEATAARREAQEREAEAWDTYHAISGAATPVYPGLLGRAAFQPKRDEDRDRRGEEQ